MWINGIVDWWVIWRSDRDVLFCLRWGGSFNFWWISKLICISSWNGDWKGKVFSGV